MQYKREIQAYGQPVISECDGRCDLEEWNGDYEGGDAKPDTPADFNKWCFRACSREHHYPKEVI